MFLMHKPATTFIPQNDVNYFLNAAYDSNLSLTLNIELEYIVKQCIKQVCFYTYSNIQI